MAERTIFAPDSDETRPVATLDFEASWCFATNCAPANW
jgi:hypothetical protein